ncbi:jg4015 [Pararge aegeria aegeria]|uniref:Jg4015 protein n=1 Tax=Pararge aegeria aegeria TaxID=348720 RepID=A0A8S4RH16_9NEOP|nr:jg4015 [Pararge aegeria aegeria]
MDNTPRCPCCKICEDCPYFQNVVNIKSAGLVIYHYSSSGQGVNSRTGETESSTGTLILHNTKNIDIASKKLIPKLDQYKKCPRCKYILEHAEKILLKVPTINKLDVLVICDKCRTKDCKFTSPCECSEAIKKFISINKYKKNKATETKEKKCKLEKLLNRSIKKHEQSHKSYDRTRSESYFKNTCLEPIIHIRAPQVDQLIESKKEFCKTNLTGIQHGRIRFSKTVDKIQLTNKNFFNAELDTDNTKYPQRRSSISQESLNFNFHAVTDKTAELRSLYKMSEQIKTDFRPNRTRVRKDNQDKEPSILDLIAEQSEKPRMLETMETPRKSTSVISDIKPGILKNETDTMVPCNTLPKYPSEFSLLVKRKDVLYRDFSYFFIKEAEKITKTLHKSKSSSELIKNTQDMLISRENELKQMLKEDLIRKFDKEVRKEITRKSLMKHKENQVVVENNVGLETNKIREVELDASTKETSAIQILKKDRQALSDKGKKSITKTVSKFEEQKKLQNQKARQQKEDNLGLEKEQKLQENEKQKREKEVQSKKENEKREKKKEEQSKKEMEMLAKGSSTTVPEKNKQSGKGTEIRQKGKEEQGGTNRETLQNGRGGKENENILRVRKENSMKEEQEREKKEKSVMKTEIEENIKNLTKKRQSFIEKGQLRLENKKIHSSDRAKAKEEPTLKLKAFQEIRSDSDSKLNIPEPKKITEEPKVKELNINQIRFGKPSPDDLLLQLVKMKQTEEDKTRKKPKTLSEIKIPLALIVEHRNHKTIQMNSCDICNDSELELDMEEILLDKAKSLNKADIIIGQKIFKYKPPLKSAEKPIDPIFISTFNDDLINAIEKNTDNIPAELLRKPLPTIGKSAENENSKGIIRYALSDRTFIEKGWTMLPTEKVVRKMNVYRMRPAHPEFDWFEHNKNKKIMQYETGEKLAEFDDNGRGRLYYSSGRLALDYYDAEEVNAQQRFVIHSSGELDSRGCSRPLAILATFDYLGNGIVFDHTGKIRLKYNQTEGVVLDRSIGPVSHWKWHTLNDPPVLQQVMIDTQMAHKDPDILKLGGPTDGKPRPDNEEMLAIEFDNFLKEKSKKLSQKFKPFQIKMKALKINEHFSLRVLDQATIYLIFRDGSTNIKLNLGMILDHQEIVDTDTAEVGEVLTSLERFPARTDSLAGLQNSITYAQRVERSRVERERRLRPNQPICSKDKLTAAISRPLHTPLHTVASDSTVATCKCRKPSSNNLYYDTRFV